MAPSCQLPWTLCRLPPWEGFSPTGQSPLTGPDKPAIRTHGTATFHAHPVLGQGRPQPHLCGLPFWEVKIFKGQFSSLVFCSYQSPTASTTPPMYTLL